MKKLILSLAVLFLILTGNAAAQETFLVRFTVTPTTGEPGGLQHPVSKEVTAVSGDSIEIDLCSFKTMVTVEENGENMSFTFDHDLEMLFGRAVIETRRITVEKNAAVHMRTPSTGAGAWLELSWGPDDMPLVYQDFILSISDILSGKENFRYGAYEDFSIMFEVQSSWEPEDRSLGYTLKDIDGDGTDELLFGGMIPDLTGTPLYDMYTITQGEIVHVFDGWDRNRYYLTADGGFMRVGSSSAFLSFNAYYVYTGGVFRLLRSVIYDMEKDPDSPWFLSYINAMDSAAGRPIDEGRAKEIMNYYTAQQIELTPFPK